MSQWLASVQSLDEAKAILPSLPDILDMKDPSKGALGALSIDIVVDVINMIDKRCLTSATVGDLAMDADLIANAITNMAMSGVDYVKVGLFPDPDVATCIVKLENVIKNLKAPVIAVLFADKSYEQELIDLLKEAGFYGVMIDTAVKNGQGLLDHWSTDRLSYFVESVQQQKMICGLAGALTFNDITLLKPLDADYLGFRSALCEQQRTNTLQLELVNKIQAAMAI